MKYLISISLLLCVCATSHAQWSQDAARPSLSLDMGSLRNRYLYPITNVRFTSAAIGGSRFRIGVRLRSYGTLFVFSRSAYDVTPTIEYMLHAAGNGFYLTAGAGLDARLRLVKDERSKATSSAEPLLSVSAFGRVKRFRLALPFWMRFYSNGMSYTVLPECSFAWSDRWSVFARYEVGLLHIQHTDIHEWRRDAFIGISVRF
jgi:hypothetical protein